MSFISSKMEKKITHDLSDTSISRDGDFNKQSFAFNNPANRIPIDGRTVTQDLIDTSFSRDVGFIIQCFALNSSGNRVVVASRAISKLYLYNIDEHMFTFKSEYPLNTKPINALSIMDICWSHLDEHLVVSCGTNCELQKWNIANDKISLDSSYRYHKRTINKLNFHPYERSTLISGDQEGHINLIDFRNDTNSPVCTFKHDAEDKVTDLQFNPLSGHTYQFASGSDNGYICIWDYRNPSKYERRFKPHMKGVHLDWHPEENNWLATASQAQDKYIYVWDLNSTSNTPIHSIANPDGVASIKWRPRHSTQIAVCSCSPPMIDRFYVWDLTRPCVPYALFDKYQNFMWKGNNPRVIVASGQNNLYCTHMSSAIRPADHSTPVAIDLNKSGSIAFAAGDIPAEYLAINNNTKKPSSANLQADLANSVNAGSHSSTTFYQSAEQISCDSDSNWSKFKMSKSKLMLDTKIMYPYADWFLTAARNYKFKGDTFEKLCEHNAMVALNANKRSIHKDWMILQTMYKDRASETTYFDSRANNNNYTDGSMMNDYLYTKTTEEIRRISETSNNSAALICFETTSSDNNNNEVLNEEFMNKNDDEDDSLLPSDIIEFNDLLEDYVNEKNHNENVAIFNETYSNLNQHDGPMNANENSDSHDANTNNLIKEFRLNILSKYYQPDYLKLNFDKHFYNILLYYVDEECDLPTAITMLLVVCGSGKYQKSNIDEVYLNEWFSQYIELLAKYELWNLRVDIIKAHQSEFIKNLTLNSIVYATMCALCKKTINKGTYICSKCNKNPFLCSFCHMPVKDLYIWCHNCMHGGHVNHIQTWFKKYNKCPTGCGCNCWNSM